MEKDIRNILIVIAFVLAVTVPFANKAYHIDDTAFLYMADQIAKDPLRPYSFVLEWGSHTNELATHLLDTPLVPYYIALVTAVFGRSELILHLSFIFFAIIGAISFYFLAKKFSSHPFAGTLVFISAPTFLISSHSLMLDVPMMSFFLLAAALFVYGVDKNNHKLMAAGSVAAGFAYLAKPNGIFIIPLLAFYCFLNKKSRYMAYQIIPILFIVLFSLHNYYFEDKVLIKEYAPFLYGKKEGSLGIIMAYFFSNLSYVGGATIFTFFLVYPFVLRRKNLLLFLASALASAILSFVLYKLSGSFASGQYSLLQISMFFIFVLASVFFVLIILSENYINTKSFLLNLLKIKKLKYDAGLLFIFAWLLVMFAVNSGISGGAVRYNTLLLPPLVLSYFFMLKRYKFNVNFVVYGVVISTLIIGILTAFADHELADTYRDFTQKIPLKYKTSANTIYYTGSLGFQYYMTENGYTMLMQNDNTPKKGDYVARARLPSPRKISDEMMQRLKFVETVTYHGTIPVKIQNPEAHAGFYTFGGGFLPYSISNAELENFDVYYVDKNI